MTVASIRHSLKPKFANFSHTLFPLFLLQILEEPTRSVYNKTLSCPSVSSALNAKTPMTRLAVLTTIRCLKLLDFSGPKAVFLQFPRFPIVELVLMDTLMVNSAIAN
jgi:hypothetical protein